MGFLLRLALHGIGLFTMAEGICVRVNRENEKKEGKKRPHAMAHSARMVMCFQGEERRSSQSKQRTLHQSLSNKAANMQSHNDLQV